MKKTLLFILFLLSATDYQNTAKAQHEYGNEGVINITQDARIDSLMVLHKQLREADSRFEGYRIQLFMEAGNDAVQRAEEFIQEFEDEYPEWPAYLSFGQPYYRVRIGNFRTRLEAEGALNSLKRQFRQAFITSDMIEPPELIAFPTFKETTP
ncbi:MAG: SPOR domain-containing protein [Bacteroidales bacterium]|nr:SPOR domain-containing protein [Bacteroidales bacterium]